VGNVLGGGRRWICCHTYQMGEAATFPVSRRRVSSAVVIITYERPDVLRDTLEYWRRVEPGPDQFLVVDASTDAEGQRLSVVQQYQDLFAPPGGHYLIAVQPSITAQRNLGLDRVEADVVLFTDDESKPEPDYLSKILEVYERDRLGVVGGVGGAERDEETARARARQLARNAGRLFARRFVGPARSALWRRRALPPGVTGLPVTPVRHLHGAKMSFRTDVVKRLSFDTHMLRYAYCEDLDMSVRVGATHALLQRRDAFVAHDESKQARVPSEATFLVSWVNPAYLTEKLCAPRPRRGPLQRLLWLKQAREMLDPTTLFRSAPRQQAIDRYALVRCMIAYLRAYPPGGLTDRFDRLQRYIFEVPGDAAAPRLDHFQRWLLRTEPPKPRQSVNA
jgi:hypothetical protein